METETSQSNNNFQLDKINLCAALIIAVIILIIIHLYSRWYDNKQEHLTIREQNRPGSAYTPEIYADEDNANLTIDDAYAALKGRIPAVRVILYHRLNCSEFAPLATVFRNVRERLECPQIQFYEEIVDSMNPIDYESYPMVVKMFKNGITQVDEVAKYEGSFDFGELQDWVLNEKIETMPTVNARAWVKTLAGEIHSMKKDQPYIPYNLRDMLPCSGGNCTDPDYATSQLDPSGETHNFM